MNTIPRWEWGTDFNYWRSGYDRSKGYRIGCTYKISSVGQS